MLYKFLEKLKHTNPCTILEVGTKAWDNKPARHYRKDVIDRIPHVRWLGLDTEAGDSVDIVGDIHHCSKLDLLGVTWFDGIILVATLEHLARPWEAAKEMAKIVKPDGLLVCVTHQTFPYHPYPKDYYRFSVEGLKEVFSLDVGWKVIDSGYDAPCKVTPLENLWTHSRDWNFAADAWLNVSCIAQRV